MRKIKKLIAAVCLAAMALTLAACGGSGESASSGSNTAADAKSYDQVVYAYNTFNNIPTAEDLAPVQEAINVITREKIGVEVTLMPISFSEYVSKVTLALQGGEKIDVFESLGNFGSCVASDMCYDITDMVDEYAAETKAMMGEDFLNACKVNGVQYGIPTYKPYALTPMVIYRKDIADELGIDMAAVQDVSDLTDVLRKVKEGHPEMTPMAPVNGGQLALTRCMGQLDWLSDDYQSPIGVLMDGEMKVVDLYSTDIFRDRINITRTWFNEGLIMKDAATTTTRGSENIASGNYFAFMAGYSYPEDDAAAGLEHQCGGYPLGARIIGDAYLSTGDINAVSWMIASTTDVPEASLKFLNLTFTDKDIVNLLIYGIEGRDYVLKDGFMSYPEGEEPSTVPYTAQLSCGTLGSHFLNYPMEGSDPEAFKWEEEQNQLAAKSPAMGFAFDASALKTQYTAVKNVLNQYLPGLYCGSLDPETELPKFINALNDAGYQDILNAKQEQLDAWLAIQ